MRSEWHDWWRRRGTDSHGNQRRSLADALESGGAAVIAVWGRIDSPGSVSGVTDETLIGVNGAEITGGFVMSGSRNVIIQNIIFSDGSNDTFELTGCECVWFDHCEFRDGSDGNLDIVRASDLITVSWSKLYYTKSHDHMLSNLCGNSNDRPDDEGKSNITFQHDWRGGTPSLAVVEGTITMLDALAAAEPDATYAIVLVTDGYPQGCDDQAIETVAAAVQGAVDRFPTHLLGPGSVVG